ncbi:MAG: endonuclease/exonuclease/phosphatase family protein [Pseudomonadota bacterium]
MRLATYNVEWFANLFDGDNQLIDDGSWSGRHDVTKSMQTAALGHVFQALDADAVMVIEAPNEGRDQSTVAALEVFAARFSLRTRKAIIGYGNDTQQEIALLYDPDVMEPSHDPQASAQAPGFETEFRIDLDTDAQPDPIVWSKPPLELAVFPKGADPMRLIGVHAKSKAPHGARTEAEAVRLSIANRRKQLAQLIWLRRRIDDHLARDEDLIVMGDFNDGPGLDEYEKLFGQSGIEIVLGVSRDADQQLYDPHGADVLRPRQAAPTSARFYNHKSRTYLNALLDYIMISPRLRARTRPVWKIWHPFDTPSCFKDDALCKALLTASDHFPVTLDLDLGS